MPKISNKEFLLKLEEIENFAFEIQGQLNIIDDAVTKISGGLLHNLQIKIYELQDILKPKEKKLEEPKETHCYNLD